MRVSSGLDDPIGFEWDGNACATRAAAGMPTIRCDVTKYRPPENITGLHASPSCVALSMAGHGGGRVVIADLRRAVTDVFDGKHTLARHTRTCARTLRAHRLAKTKATKAQASAWAWQQARLSALIVQPARWIVAGNPEWVTLEQVPPAMPVWEAYAAGLRKLGYSVWCGVLNAADYSVPQTRRRAILVASQVRTATPPEPTHCNGGGSTLFGELQPWVSMADALSWGFADEPAVTVTAGGTSTGGADAMLAGGAGGRAAYRDAMEGTGRRWVVAPHRGQGMIERHGPRPPHEVDQPSPTVIPKARSWRRQMIVDRRQNSRGPQGTTVPDAPVSVDRPAPTFTGKSGSQWVIRTNNATSDGDEMHERSVDDPAPTLTSRGDMWQLRPGKQPNATVRTADEPAPTIAFGHGASQWMWERPATVILGDPRVSPPNRSGGAPQGARPVTTDGVSNGEYVDPLASVRLTVEEAAVLQSFPPDWPFSGSKSARFLQVGNSCPPVMMAHVLAAATGTPIPDVWCDPLVRVDSTDVTEGDDDG